MRIILITLILTVNLSHPLIAKIASVIGNPISQEIYFEVNKDTKNYPASLTKIMTLYILFDELKLKKPKIVRYDSNKVSEKLKSFYEVNRIVKSKVIDNKLNYKFKYPDYKLALLDLTKSLLNSN